MNKTQIVILAGGTGERFGGDLPKQFIKIAGKTIMEHTIERIEQCDCIDSIIIVVHAMYYEYANQLVVNNKFHKVKKVIKGGNTRQESSYAGIMACDQNTVNILFHDAIRPFVSERIILDTVKALDHYAAVDVAIPCADTIIKVNDSKIIESIPERKYLMRGQTPQGFHLSLIKAAYERYLQEEAKIPVTDDCGIIAYYDMAEIFVVDGEEQNIKITYKEDAYLADKLFQTGAMTMVHQQSMKEITDLLSDKVGVVIGHTSGIGKDIYEVVKSSGSKIYGLSKSSGTDISYFEQINQSLNDIYLKESHIDYVINCAGVLNISKLDVMPEAQINEIIMTNYLGTVNVTKAAIPFLVKSKGSILLFTSSSYTRGRAMYSIYSSTKAAIVNFAQAMSEELYESGVRINILNPERTNTPMRKRNFGIEPPESLLDSKTVAEEALRAVLLNITGQVIDVRRQGS